MSSVKKLSHLFEDISIMSYAIITKETTIKCVLHLVKEIVILQPGTAVIIITDKNSKSNKTIKIYDDQNTIYNNNVYVCPSKNLTEIADDVWLFAIAISDIKQRYKFICCKNQIHFTCNLTKNSLVVISGVLIKQSGYFHGIVKYIGLAPEMGIGCYFGIEFLQHSKQQVYARTIKESILQKYMPECDPEISIIVPANYIFQQHTIDFEINKQLSDFQAESANGNLNYSSKENKHTKFQESRPSADKETSKIDKHYLPNIIDSLTNNMDNKQKYSNTYIGSDNGSSSSEKTYEPLIYSTKSNSSRDYADSLKPDINKSKHYNLKNQSNIGFHDDNKTSNGPPGILKTSRPNNHDSTFQPNQKEIINVSQEFIKKSLENENNISVIYKNEVKIEMELAETLGPNWPASAGNAGQLLNNERPTSSYSSSNSSSSSFQTNERNKSCNPLSHFKRVTDKKSKDGKNKNSVDNGRSDLHTASDDEYMSSMAKIPNSFLELGSMIEVATDVRENLYGVIKWIGNPHGSSECLMVGVELEEEPLVTPIDLTDGIYNGRRYFKCSRGRALFIEPHYCSIDHRFGNNSITTQITSKNAKQMFGQMDCPKIFGKFPPLQILKLENLDQITGDFKGIQGHHNSCYLDATLFAMFTFTSVFDALLYRQHEHGDIAQYEMVQSVLRDEIVNPLRKNRFVRADRVLKLRQLLEELGSVTGLTSEEKDPEEFLNSLLAQIMKAEPFLKLNSGQEAFYYQLFVDKNDGVDFPTVQQLFEQSFCTSGIKLNEVPSCLIIQMPRFGKSFKMYPRILPSPVLDITNIIENSPRQCTICGKLAHIECKACFGERDGLESTSYCDACFPMAHSHEKRSNHSATKLNIPTDFIPFDQYNLPRIFMELFAVVCIETSHYVSFVKTGPGKNAPWCFFDSMADHKGEQNGYNIPKMISVPEIPHWLSEEGSKSLHQTSLLDKMLPEHSKRLLCDAYMCMYQSSDVMMYK